MSEEYSEWPESVETITLGEGLLTLAEAMTGQAKEAFLAEAANYANAAPSGTDADTKFVKTYSDLFPTNR